MDKETRLALLNISIFASELKPGESVPSERFFEVMSKRPDILPSDAVIRHSYRHYVTNRGVPHAQRVVSYSDAAQLAGTTVAAIRQAAYRRRVTPLTEYLDGIERRGVTLRSLAEWRGWTQEQLQKASRSLLAQAEKNSRLLRQAVESSSRSLLPQAEKNSRLLRQAVESSSQSLQTLGKSAELAETPEESTK